MYNQNYSSPTTLGIQERWERVLAYAFIWVSGLILLFVEHRNQTVRRHAMQSVIIFGCAGPDRPVCRNDEPHPIIGFVFGLIAGLVGFVTFALWILLMVLAYFSPNTIFVGPRNARYV